MPLEDTSEVIALVRRYYAALEAGAPLPDFYIPDDLAGDLGPVVKFGSGKDEEFTGFPTVRQAVEHVPAAFHHNRLESRALHVRRSEQIAWFSDLVWWSGDHEGKRFASLTRWTGVCLLTKDGWRFLQIHVSEGI